MDPKNQEKSSAILEENRRLYRQYVNEHEEKEIRLQEAIPGIDNDSVIRVSVKQNKNFSKISVKRVRVNRWHICKYLLALYL
jgi:hypothetical protein